MKKNTFKILTIIFSSLTIILFILYVIFYFVLSETYWVDFSLGLAISSLIIDLFFIFLYFFNNSKLPIVKQGKICPYCKHVLTEEETICPNCKKEYPNKK